jgi:hypothetical protein
MQETATITSTSAPPTIQPRALRLKFAARYLAVSPRNLAYMVERGDLAPRCIGRARVFLIDELDAFLESRPTTQQRGQA